MKEKNNEAEVLAQAGVRAEPGMSSHAARQAMRDAWQVLFDVGVIPGLAPMSLAEGIKQALAAPTIPAQVPAAEVRAQALEMARSYIEAMSAEPGYGFARPANPHDFCPDAECCNADEIAAHKAACEAYDKGEYTPERGSEWVGAMHILRAPWGIGSYTMRDEQAVKVLAAIDSALAQSSTADKASEVRAAEWVSVEDRLPEKECLAVYVTPNGKQRLIRAKYARQFQIEAEGDDYETEYNDDDDTFYIKAGWLECIDNWGEYSSCYVVEGTVTHWMNLPAAPSTADSGNKGEQA